jgi:16S rRNA (cytosine967-C5)-methyltransferase
MCVLDTILSGTPAEQALTNWARASRFAGSGDREALRDLVFRALRQRRSLAALGGAETGRGLILGMLRAEGERPGWDGTGHAPAPLSPSESALFDAPPVQMPDPVALDWPDWLWPILQRDHGPRAAPIAQALRQRAPVFVRVNTARATVAQAILALKTAGIAAHAHPLAETALEITAGARRLRASAPMAQGLVEPQDAASQAVALDFARHVPRGARVLDYCAGGGGKALALAAQGLRVAAHDISAARMRDIAQRAHRAGSRIDILPPGETGNGWGAILIDAPCSGSGSWRRDPAGKWALTPERLAALVETQARILDICAGIAAPQSVIGYATCSVLAEENSRQIARFLTRHPGWSLLADHAFSPCDGGDGFFLACLTRR